MSTTRNTNRRITTRHKYDDNLWIRFLKQAEAYKDVIHEDSLKIGGATKSPDYSFRIGGVRKFFVETKKPSVNIRQDTSPAYQLRRYARSAKLPLSILTDFEEFAVYDCRFRPQQSDAASKGRILYLKFDQFEERWEEIASVFSRDAILKGSFDKFAESNKRKRGTAEVDDAFLDEIEGWRTELAKNIARKNVDLSQPALNGRAWGLEEPGDRQTSGNRDCPRSPFFPVRLF